MYEVRNSQLRLLTYLEGQNNSAYREFSAKEIQHIAKKQLGWARNTTMSAIWVLKQAGKLKNVRHGTYVLVNHKIEKTVANAQPGQIPEEVSLTVYGELLLRTRSINQVLEPLGLRMRIVTEPINE